ncbi:hypothetical protein SAMN05428961_1172 [Paenibacillus sp. OK060]|uniref:hypothetical protein n=1 Tax=Paenibacillus sp. OK060 TaxID=1881034 RepID=UPI0008815810|nr:hypothetical protein [Paenibacillus sp. OK060]SDM41544.1 hypothetical protein SAMN05428961_1172 [Paenibacillus sp. OK060]
MYIHVEIVPSVYPGAFSTYTYVTRQPKENFSYETRLEQSILTIRYLTSIIGTSKTGKSVLCEKVIGLDNIVNLSGNDFKENNDFGAVVASKVGISLQSSHFEYTKIEGGFTSELTEGKSTTITESFRFHKDKVIQYFKSNNLVLVLDDFKT